jgi:HEAT repeat protein
MPRKNSSSVSDKKHTAVPAAPPKKAAEVAKVEPVKPAVTVEATKPVAAVQKQSAAVATAIAALRDTDADTARDAATALGGLGDASAVEPLIDVLTNANGYFHCVVRAAAASSLAQLRDARAFAPLCNATRDEMAEASAEAVRALAAMGDARAATVLIDIVRNPTGYFLSTVRLAAVAGLTKLGGDQAKTELARVAADPSEDAVIRQAARNL